MNKNRLEAFSDGVFAIVITLLVLEIRPDLSVTGGWAMFRHALPHILIYALSFVMVGLYWVAHHNMLHFVARIDRGFLWWNLLLLLVVAFIPFPAALLGATGADAGALRVYCATLALTNVLGTILWAHATRGRRLAQAGLPGGFARFVVRLHLVPVLFYAVAAAVAGPWRWLSLVLIALVPAFYVLPNPFIDRRVREAQAAVDAARRER